VPCWHLATVLIDFAGLRLDRAALMARLREGGIGSQVHYVPVPRQPYYAQRYGAPDLPGADAYYARTLSLPLHAGVSEADVARICGQLSTMVGGARLAS